MNIAFFAPLKSPWHTVPSGDRSMARALIAALQDGGATVTLASELRSRDNDGNRAFQEKVIADADQQLPAIISKGRAENWQAWVTYHNYYKAPDLLGPAVCAALNIPYLLVEATRARKRLNGPWATFAARAEAASDAAETVFYLTERDAEALMRDAPRRQSLVHLRPFLNTKALPPRSSLTGPMLSVGMMRAGDKLATYLLIADTLARLRHPDWRLDIVGDGPVRGRVEDMMAPFGSKVRFLGRLDEAEVQDTIASARLLFWPGVNEAFGMTYLEAQAAGVPVVAQDRPGVRDVVFGPAPPPRDGPDPMADMLEHWLDNKDDATAHGEKARRTIEDRHLRPTATETLMRGISDAVKAIA